MTKTLFLIACLFLVRDSAITWTERVAIANHPSKYGSEYGRMLNIQGKTWLAAYTFSRNEGYRKDPNGGLELEISRSDDNGRHWKSIAIISDPGRDLDNAQMIQLPDRSILLAGRSVRWQESYRLPVYRSTDNGLSWTLLSTIDSNEGKPGELGKPDKGMYEPHFYFLADGRLGVLYANEKHVTDSLSYSQIISQKISADHGRTWGPEIWVAYEPGHPASRPGMPVWTRMKNGEYIVVYEICGPEKCNIYYKTSKDGFNWPVGHGTPIPGQLGAPYILSLTDGRLVLTSNSSNISISEDYGAHWRLADTAFSKTLWPAIYQTGKKEIVVINGVGRPTGGHNVHLRFGRLRP